MDAKDGALRNEAALDELVPDSQVKIAGDVLMRHMRLHRKGRMVEAKIRQMAQSNYVAVAKMIENLDKILADAKELQMQTGSEFLGEITEPAQGMKQALIQAFEQISQLDVVNDAFDQQQGTGPMTQGQPAMPTQGQPVMPTAGRKTGGWDQQPRPEIVEATKQLLSQGERPLEEVGNELQQSGWPVEDVEKTFDEGLEKGLWDMSKKGMDLWLSLRPQVSTGQKLAGQFASGDQVTLQPNPDAGPPRSGPTPVTVSKELYDTYYMGTDAAGETHFFNESEAGTTAKKTRFRIKRTVSGLREAKWEITNLDNGQTQYVDEEEAKQMFGEQEWEEVKQGYAPNIVAVETDYGSPEEADQWWNEKMRSGGRSPKVSARLDAGEKRKINSALEGAGFDGNGRFRDTNDMVATATQVLDQYGYNFGLISAYEVQEPEAHKNFFVYNTQTSEELDNSMLVLSWYTHENDQVEVVAYMS